MPGVYYLPVYYRQVRLYYVVSVWHAQSLFANDPFKGYLINKIIEELKEMEETELKEVYSSILSRKVKVEK